jgi:hypothetical protein
MIDKGNEYLREGQKCIVSAERQKELKKIREIMLEMQNQRKVYPNYLTEITNNRTQPIKKSPNKMYGCELSRIQTIIENKSIKKLDKVEEVKTSLQKLSFVYQSNREHLDEQLIEQMKAKIQLL